MKAKTLTLVTMLLVCTGCPLFVPLQFEAQVVPFRQFVGEEALNNEGAVVGVVAAGFDPLSGGGVWKDGMFTMLPGPQGSVANPFLINDEGLVVGSFEFPAEAPFQMWQNGAVMELPAPSNAPEFAFVTINGINNLGDLVGSAMTAVDAPVNLPRAVPVVRYADGTAEQLPLFRRVSINGIRTFRTSARVINNSGTIGGTAIPYDITDSAEAHPVVWENGEIRRLPTPGESWGGVSDINDSGWAVGSVHSTGGIYAPVDTQFVVWVDGQMRKLRMLGAEPFGTIDINNSGNVLATYRRLVNRDDNEDGEEIPWLFTVLWRWDPVTERHYPLELNHVTDIPGAEDVQFRGQALNDQDQILVRVFDTTAQDSTLYLLTPASPG